MKKASIFIADDHPMFLSGLENFLKDKKYAVIGTASDGQTAYNSILKHEPDIAILDFEMPKMTGIEIIKECSQNELSTKIILLSYHKEATVFHKAKEFGAYGYLLKEFTYEMLEECINSVLQNKPYFPEKLLKSINTTDFSNNTLSIFTGQELKILKMISDYKSTQEIADILFCSQRTVEKHRSNIIKKLNLQPKTNALNIWVLQNKRLF